MKKILSIKQKRFFKIFFLILTILFLLNLLISCHGSKSITDTVWNEVPQILKLINKPVFQDQEYSILNYGAIGDGKTDCTEAFRTAIEHCHLSGGGKVVVPEGIYLTGAIHLKSNVNLHITKNATILFSQDTKKFLPTVYTRFEGVECINYSPFIYAFGQQNIAITGSGTLDGQASTENWWSWKGRKEYGWDIGEPNGNNDIDRLFRIAEEGQDVEERIFGEGYHLRPNFIQPYKCNNILIDSITIKNSPMWVIHPVLCNNVTIQNVTVISHGPNNDGCNPESSKNVWIKNCYFDTGDDCIAIKSGRNADGRRINVRSENIVIQKCTMKDGHGGVVIGSEMSGNVRNIFAEDCIMDSPNLERVLRIKTNSVRGGIVENVYLRNCTIGEVSEAIIKINFNYSEGDRGNFTPVVRSIYINNINSKKSTYALFLQGYERSPISDLVLENCNFNNVKEGNLLYHYRNLTMKNVYINEKLQEN